MTELLLFVALSALAPVTPVEVSVDTADGGRIVADRYGGESLPAIEIVDLREEQPERGRWLAPRMMREIEARLDLAGTIIGPLRDDRDPTRVRHSYAEMARARMLMIAAGYEDCDDVDTLRSDPALKIAVGRCPETGTDLMSQPTLSRLENLADWRALARIGLGQIDLYCKSFARPPTRIVLDIEDGFCRSNSGRYFLDGGARRAGRCDEAADIRVSIQALGSAYPRALRRRVSDLDSVFVASIVSALTLSVIALSGAAGTLVALAVFSLATGFAYPIQRQLVTAAIPASGKVTPSSAANSMPYTS